MPQPGEPVHALGNVLWIPARYMFAILAAMSMAITYGLKVCLSVALVSMLNHTALAVIQNRVPKEPIDPKQDGPFEWTNSGFIISSYFIGYIVAEIPGGYLAEHVSAKWVLWWSVVINTICTGLTPPFSIHMGANALIILRVIEGLCGGVTFPATHELLAHWAPVNERSVLSAIAYAGTALGTMASNLLSGWIAACISWEWIFYIFAALSAVWIVFWLILGSDSPSHQRFISQSERDYIIASLGEHKEYPTPWKKIFTSVPFYAIVLAHLTSNWGWYVILLELPFFMKDVLNFELSKNATLVAIPYLTLWLFSLVLSKSLDTLRAKGLLSTTNARRIANCIATVGPGTCLMVICNIRNMPNLTVGMTALATTLHGAMFVGHMSNHIDISPNHAGILMALTNTIATIPGIMAPLCIAFLTDKDPSIASWSIIFYATIAFYIVQLTPMHSWNIIFYVTIVLYTIQFAVYTLWGSGDDQQWDDEFDMESTESVPLRERKGKFKNSTKKVQNNK